MSDKILPVNYTKLTWQEKRTVREQYIKLQNGLCCHCNSNLYDQPPKELTDKPINWDRFPPNFLKYPIHLHHCHKTGMTIGAAHSFCNAYMFDYLGE